jgi:iron complex outermembrane recepter protein
MTTRCALTILLLLAGATAASSNTQPDTQTLKGLTLDELLTIDVSLAARRPETIRTASAAISVIRGDEIRRSGATTVADAIALADGLFVGRFNNGTWAIGARGFTGASPNKLLVMIDGRTVYSELFTGVFWNTLDYVLEDIDRIEIIRGPGAVLWGANAVNGVINIVTRHTRDTQGTFVQLETGNEDRALGEVRYGGTAGTLATWRVYGKYAHRDAQQFSTDISAEDTRRRGQVGFRLDGGTVDGTTWLVKGDAFHSGEALIDRPASEFSDFSLQAQWSRPLGSSRIDIQSFYRREYRRVVDQLTHYLDTADVDVQHTFRASRHQIVWGAGARFNRDTTHPSRILSFAPASRSYPLVSAFVQDEIGIVPNRAFFTLGAKVEHNAFSGADVQPSVRGRIAVGRGTLWGATSRAVRRPTRFDQDIRITTPTGLLLITGNEGFESESLLAHEGGYRVQPTGFLALDLSVFRHRFSRLRSQDSPASGIIPVVVGNTLNGRSRGIELGVDVQPFTQWRTHLSYTRLSTRVTPAAGSRDATSGVSEANDPSHIFGLRTAVDLPGNVEADAFLRGIGPLPNPEVPGYVELNLRVGWKVRRGVELALVGQDLIHDQHPEFGTAVPRREEFQRSVRALMTLRLP